MTPGIPPNNSLPMSGKLVKVFSTINANNFSLNFVDYFIFNKLETNFFVCIKSKSTRSIATAPPILCPNTIILLVSISERPSK